VIALAKIAVLIHYFAEHNRARRNAMPASPREIVRNNVKEKLARGEVVMLPILLHRNR
jgi:hypothetical protein